MSQLFFYNEFMKFMFDCDDTLYDLQWPFKMCVKELLKTDVDFDAFYKDYRMFGDMIFDKLQNGSITVDESGIYRIVKACEKYNIPINHHGAVEFQKRYRYYQKHISMDDELLEYFSSTHDELAILTNGKNEHQRNKLETLKVFNYVPENHIFTSEEIGYAKPNPKAFLECFKRMNQPCFDWYYIGDNYINDMEGAKKVGMKTIHFNRHHQKSGDAADFEVFKASELIELFRCL